MNILALRNRNGIIAEVELKVSSLSWLDPALAPWNVLGSPRSDTTAAARPAALRLRRPLEHDNLAVAVRPLNVVHDERLAMLLGQGDYDSFESHCPNLIVWHRPDCRLCEVF
jgi:hypothetical protein